MWAALLTAVTSLGKGAQQTAQAVHARGVSVDVPTYMNNANWTVATGGSSAQGARTNDATGDMVQVVVAVGVMAAAVLLIGAAIRRA